MSNNNEILEWHFERIKLIICDMFNSFHSLRKSLGADKKRVKKHIDEINTFEDQINKSIDLLQYSKRQFKSKRCQNALKKIKEEYKLE